MGAAAVLAAKLGLRLSLSSIQLPWRRGLPNRPADNTRWTAKWTWVSMGSPRVHGLQETEVRGDQAVVGCSRRMQKRGVCAPVRYDFLDKCLNSTSSQFVVTFWTVHVAVFCVACGSRSSLIAVCCPKQHPGRQAETCRSVENSIASSSPLLVAVCAVSASASGHRSQSSCADTET